MTAQVIIIGAGMTGLVCARRLADAGIVPIVLDKGRGIGGRVATRRIVLEDNQLQFDHGAQYATARDPNFRQLLNEVSPACAIWQAGSAAEHFVGVPAMSSLPRAVAAGIDVRQNVEVTALRQTSDGWIVEAGPESFKAAHVVLTVPAPQIAALLGQAHPLAKACQTIELEPCLTLMAAFLPTAPKPFISRADTSEALSWIAQDSTKSGRSSAFTTWVAQASTQWSALHLEEDASTIALRMLPLLCAAIGAAPEDARRRDAQISRVR